MPPPPLVVVELEPIRAQLGVEKKQFARLLGVSPRTLARYLATGQAPLHVLLTARALKTGRSRITPEGAVAPDFADLLPEVAQRQRERDRARLLRIGDAYAASILVDQARSCYVEAGLTLAQANARLGRLHSVQAAEAVARAAMIRAARRADHAAYMRAARAQGRYKRRRRVEH